MNKFVINTSEDKSILSIGQTNLFYIFENIKGYEEEVYDLFESRKMSIPELEMMINSWGGKLKIVTLKQLINNYYKNL